MKKLIVLLSASLMLMMGCSRAQINWNIDKDVLALAAANEVGYQLAKQYPDIADTALEYAQAAMDAAEPGTFQEQFDKWKDYVLAQLGADPHYKRQLSRFMPNITLPEGSGPDTAWMDKVRPYLQEFIYGIEDARVSIIKANLYRDHEAQLERYRMKLTEKMRQEREELKRASREAVRDMDIDWIAFEKDLPSIIARAAERTDKKLGL